MIANVVTLGVVLFLIFVFFEAAGDNAVFFIVINALILAAAVGLARCHEIRQIMAIRRLSTILYGQSLRVLHSGLL